MSALVSILTVVYNGEMFLEETIKSVIGQDYSNIEYVIVDGGSTDGTLAIIEKYRSHFSTLVSEPDKGIYDAINKGIDLCSGEVIKIQNADDLLLPGAVSLAMAELERQGLDLPVIVIGQSRVINAEGETQGHITQRPIIFGFDSFNHPGWFATAAVYRAFGQYSLDYKVSSDYEYYLRFKTGGGRIVWIDKPLASYRQDGTSSGMAGVREVARINRTYLGPVWMAIVLTQHLGGKLLRPLWRNAKGVFGSRATT